MDTNITSIKSLLILQALAEKSREIFPRHKGYFF